MDAKAYYVLLSMVDGLGPRRLAALVEHFGTAEKVWFAGERDLRYVPGIGDKVISCLVTRRRELKPEQEIQRICDLGIRVISREEREYPQVLKRIYDPPQILYLRGNTEVLNKAMFAIVGARKATHYGITMARRIAAELTYAGLGITSGMARGIDTAAHMGALDAGGPTVAVLGCGVDVVYPRENRKLMEQIIDKSAVISEFPPGTSPVGGNFPQRNRIISGLASGVLVIEAAQNSGSLITADFALEQGRDVFALPGQVTHPLNKGCHMLIRQGACLVEQASDILDEMGIIEGKGGHSFTDIPDRDTNNDLTPEEKKVYNVISDDPVSSEVIIERAGLKPSEVLAILAVMEINGLVRLLPGRRYVRYPGF